LNDVSIRFDVDADYDIARTQLTHNVVALVEGSDPQLRSSYVALGAHYDHIGYAERSAAPGNERPPGAPGRVTAGTGADHIWNGADDNGSGTVTLMALARAFREGPPPKRSIVFVWHTGEEAGLYGSRYFADYPTVPIDAIVAQLNIDMVGRNRNDDQEQANTVYLVGSDRISSELHEISRAANGSLPHPLTLDYEMNDPSDPEQLYYRSDHYSYAAKGDSGDLLHHRPSPRLPCEHRRSVENPVRQADARRRPDLRDRVAGGEPRSRAGPRPPRRPRRQGDAVVDDASAAGHLSHDLRQSGRLRDHHSAAPVLRRDLWRVAARRRHAVRRVLALPADCRADSRRSLRPLRPPADPHRQPDRYRDQLRDAGAGA
jgi:hypothetical protein